jgi:hypothetical protein
MNSGKYPFVLDGRTYYADRVISGSPAIYRLRRRDLELSVELDGAQPRGTDPLPIEGLLCGLREDHVLIVCKGGLREEVPMAAGDENGGFDS